jgi:hypothetical protein
VRLVGRSTQPSPPATCEGVRLCASSSSTCAAAVPAGWADVGGLAARHAQEHNATGGATASSSNSTCMIGASASARASSLSAVRCNACRYCNADSAAGPCRRLTCRERTRPGSAGSGSERHGAPAAAASPAPVRCRSADTGHAAARGSWLERGEGPAPRVSRRVGCSHTLGSRSGEHSPCSSPSEGAPQGPACRPRLLLQGQGGQLPVGAPRHQACVTAGEGRVLSR